MSQIVLLFLSGRLHLPTRISRLGLQDQQRSRNPPVGDHRCVGHQGRHRSPHRPQPGCIRQYFRAFAGLCHSDRPLLDLDLNLNNIEQGLAFHCVLQIRPKPSFPVRATSSHDPDAERDDSRIKTRQLPSGTIESQPNGATFRVLLFLTSSSMGNLVSFLTIYVSETSSSSGGRELPLASQPSRLGMLTPVQISQHQA